MIGRRERFLDWMTSKDERFYRGFLIIMLAIFGTLTLVWILAAGAFVACVMWWIFYETIIIKSGHRYIPVERKQP